jgi:membrane fusion protein, multidrug efflux system
MRETIEIEEQEERAVPAEQRNRAWAYIRKNPRAKWLLIGIAMVAIVAVSAAWYYFSARESTDDAQIDGHIIPISARVGGPVASVNVNDNQYVEAGALLVQIDPRDYQVALERAQADFAAAQATARAARTSVPITSATTGSQLSSSQASVLKAKAGVEASEKEINAAQARLSLARARLQEAQANDTRASKDLDRMEKLIAKDEVSQQQYDAAVATAASSRATVDSAQAAVAEAESRVRVAESDLQQSLAKLDQAQAEVQEAQTAPQQVAVSQARASSEEAKAQQAKAAADQAQLNLQYTSVRAPAGGVISKKTVEVGQVVQPGQPLMALVPLEDIWVTANFKETALNRMHPGQAAIISVDAYGGHQYRGHVDSISAATGEKFSLLPPENATGNYVKVVQRVPVKIVFDKGQDPKHLLRPGMSVEATVITK